MTHSRPDFPRSVLWTRGAGCRDLASALGAARPVEGDLRAACIRTRADLLVARKLTSFDLISVAVPHDYRPDAVTEVIAAVAGGPHSALAAVVASRLSNHLEVPGWLASASASATEDDAAESMLSEVGSLVPELPTKVVRADGARHLVDDLGETALLVLGAAGGSWMQRQFFGPGRRLVVRAPGGAVVVRRSPERCFHVMDEPAGFGPGMPIVEARRVMEGDLAAIVEDGRLIGMVRRRDLVGEGAVADVMVDPVFLHEDDPLAAAEEMAGLGSPLPVVDGDGRLKGLLGQ